MTRYVDMEGNYGFQPHMPARCMIIFSNINGLHGNFDEIAVANSGFCCEINRSRYLLHLQGTFAPVVLLLVSRRNEQGSVIYS